MSAAIVRVERKPRAEHDYYPTPRWVVDAIVPYLPIPQRVFDPACGTGELLSVYPEAEKTGIEIDRERASRVAGIISLVHGHDSLPRVTVGDALTTPWPSADLLIMNPPFKRANEFIRRAMEWRRAGPYRPTVACLARLTILESESRRELHTEYPSDVYVLARRPSFAHGKTDSTTCVWLVWSPGGGGRWRVI